MSQIKRRCHCLKREKTLAMPRSIIFFDTETEQVILDNGSIRQDLKLGWACFYKKSYGRHLSKEDWHYFENPLTFWTFVFRHLEPKQKLWIIARNIVFDFTVCQGWKYLRQAGFKLKFFHNEGTTCVISVKNKHGSILFCDSMNWFRESLEKTGQRINIPKMKIDFKTCNIVQLSTYCRNDVLIEMENFKGFIRFLESHSISRLCYTIGSTAMAAYLFGHYHKKIYIHNNEQAIDLERRSYTGGRVECFYIGSLNNSKYYLVDVNSLYPYVMANNDYPIKYKKQIVRPSVEDLTKYLNDFAVVADCIIQTREPAYPVKRDRTIFPVGRFRTVLTTGELRYAVTQGHIAEVNRLVLYHKACIFKTYVQRFYALRQQLKQQGNKEYENICKLLLNSLYGKFGQKGMVWDKIGECHGERDRVETCYSYDGKMKRQVRYLLGEIFELTGIVEAFNSFPAIASHVTSYGRMYLYDLMLKAGKGNYYYCDTDSLIVNAKGLEALTPLLNDTTLGYLKVENTVTGLVIKGLKDYELANKIVIKGIRKNAKQVEQGVYVQEQWPSFKGLLRSDDANVYTMHKTTKILNRKYYKGNVTETGEVEPYLIDETLLFV